MSNYPDGCNYFDPNAPWNDGPDDTLICSKCGDHVEVWYTRRLISDDSPTLTDDSAEEWCEALDMCAKCAYPKDTEDIDND